MAVRKKRSGTYAYKLVQQLEQRAADRETPDSPTARASTLVVPLTRHEEREFGKLTPCILSTTLRETFSANALLRVVSKRQPELRFYARADPANFNEHVRGISILRTIAEAAKLNDKDVELVEVTEDEAKLRKVVMVIFDRYLSKRDLWHLHLAMMQEGGQVTYSGYNQNFHHDIPHSRIDELTCGSDSTPVFSGRVSPHTEVIFKSGSANMTVMIQVSAELLAFGLSGRPYWQILLESFGQLIDRSLRVPGSDGNGHYIRMVLFLRLRKPARCVRVRSDGPSHTDFYEVFWEGHAKTMPPTQHLLAAVRSVCIHLQEDLHKSQRHEGQNCEFDDSPSSIWYGIRARDLVEASHGNLLECLNIVLDHFDQHHLDRNCHLTGQEIIVLTAGNGLIRPTSKALYELTHLRFTVAAPSGSKGLHIICVRQPPLHPVPWMYWPGGPSPFDTSPAGISTLPVSPEWIELAYHSEVSFSPYAGATYVSSSLLPLESFARISAPVFVPPWTKDVEWMQRLPELEVEPTSHSSHLIRPVLRTCPEFWKELRAPQLRPYYKKVSMNGDLSCPSNTLNFYTMFPIRFPDTDKYAELLYLMNDLIGCRLEVRTSELIYHDDGQLAPLDSSSPTKEVNQSARITMRDCEWSMNVQDNGLKVAYRELEGDDNCVSKLSHKSSFYIRRRCLAENPLEETESLQDQGSTDISYKWEPCRRIFHLPQRPAWNSLDSILAGICEMPAALPYPAKESTNIGERCPGWMLRSVIKQHLYIFVPQDPDERSHEDLFSWVVQVCGGGIDTGVDPFLHLEKKEADESRKFFHDGEEASHLRERSIARFGKLINRLAELCFVNKRESFGVTVVPDGTDFTVQRKTKTVYVRDMDIPSAFAHSRDWFELFYDSHYAPPRAFLFVLQWMVCSSVHLVSFISMLRRIAEDNGFILIRAPIGQLFPQPAPYWIWSDRHETNFDRLSFYAPRKIRLPSDMNEELRKKLNAELLSCWLRQPLDFFFLFATSVADYKVQAIEDRAAAASTSRVQSWEDQGSQSIFQRLRGWVLSSKDGNCFVALREKHIFFYESRVFDVRDFRASQRRLRDIELMWRVFFSATEEVFLSMGCTVTREPEFVCKMRKTPAPDKLETVHE